MFGLWAEPGISLSIVVNMRLNVSLLYMSATLLETPWKVGVFLMKKPIDDQKFQTQSIKADKLRVMHTQRHCVGVGSICSP